MYAGETPTRFARAERSAPEIPKCGFIIGLGWYVANDSSSNIIKNTGVITIATMCSRVTGLIRTWAMAFALGNTLLTSAYQVAYNLPSMIYELAAAGLLSTAFLPVYLLTKEKQGKEAADRFSSNILTMTLIMLGLIALLCSIFSPQVMLTQTFTISDPTTNELAAFFFRVFAIQILLYGLGSVITGMLNAERVYVVPAVAPIINNIVVIITMFGYVPLSAMDPNFAMWWLAIGTSLGVLCQFGAQLPILIKHGFKYKPIIDFHDPMLKEALKIALPMMLYVAGTMVTFSCRNAFSLDATPNGPSTLNYAWMWFQLPYGVLAVSLSTTLMTELSDCAAREDWSGFRNYITKGVRSTYFLIIPMAAMVCAMAVPLMNIFQAGAFNAEDTIQVGTVLSVWVFCLPLYSAYMYLHRSFAAIRHYLAFTLIDIAVRLVIQVGLYWLLTREGMLGLLGIPVADFVFYGVMVVICNALIKHYVGSREPGVPQMMLKTVAAAAIPGIIVYFVSNGIMNAAALAGAANIALAFGVVIVCGLAGLAAAFALTKLFGIEEFNLLPGIWNKLAGKFLRRA